MSVTTKFAAQIAERDGGWLCHYCGLLLIPIGQLHVYGIPDGTGSYFIPDGMDTCVADHVMPKSQGGRDELSNLVLACSSCNTRKGTMGYDDFVRKTAR
jgi:5-methylcytosine-specific restriction endonuclease McrA